MQNLCNKLMLKKAMTVQELSMAVDTAMFMGFNRTSAEFPITSYDEGRKIASSLDELKDLCPNEESPKEGYVSSTKGAQLIPEFVKKNRGIEALFLNEEFVSDEDYDGLPDKVNFKIVMPSEYSDSMAEAACNFAFRTGMEVTKIESGFMAKEGYRGNSVVFKKGQNSEIYISKDEYKHINIVCGDDIVDFLSNILNNFPDLSYSFSWSNYLREVEDSMTLKNLDGQAAFAKSIYDKEKAPIKVYAEPSCEKEGSKFDKFIPNAEYVNFKGLKEAYTQEFDIPWEKEVFEDILNEKLYPVLRSGDKVDIYGSLSEDLDVRTALIKEVSSKVAAHSATAENVEITCAYKQGYSWIEDFVLPKLCNRGVKKVNVQFKAFLPEGQTEWLDEDGATPSYTNIGGDTPDKWYDLPIRFLQELYPVDDLIASKLGIKADDVEYSVYEGSDDLTYVLTALDEKGNEVYTDTYKVNVNERPYLDKYPNMGKVHPASGFVKILINGKVVVDEKIKTDIENIWDRFNKDVLSKCREHIMSRGSETLSPENQPFFSRLKLEAFVSEPERVLDSRQDLISPLDALHEDMYFVASDYFKNMGDELCKAAFDAPGLILPVLHNSEGKPKFKATLYDRVMDEACVVSNGTVHTLPGDGVNAYLTGFRNVSGKTAAVVTLTGADKDTVRAYAELLENGVLHVNQYIRNVQQIIFKSGDMEASADIPKYAEPEKNRSINDIDLPTERVIGYDEYIRIMEELKAVPGIEVYEAGRSYSDRIIYAIDVLPKNETGYISRTKRLSKYPCQLINCRHHANEVSSTNACFQILKELLTNEEYSHIGDTLNLLFVPIENPDGTAIHEELSKEHPLWKFHVARFDALSKEFFQEVFKDNTIHTEARVFRRLYEERLPDLVVDNHGVPSHEWEQQFSGYTSPSFKGFWLPRSILYGYFWTVPNEQFSDNLVLSHEIEHEVAVAIGKDKQMTDLNIEMANRFEKYAHNWMPKLFPANYYMNMINYWVSKDFDMTQRYVSHRNPWITTTYYTSEVADETAQGEYLELCTKAHYTHNMAILDIMRKVETVTESHSKISGNTLYSSFVRQRPVLVSKA